MKIEMTNVGLRRMIADERETFVRRTEACNKLMADLALHLQLMDLSGARLRLLQRELNFREDETEEMFSEPDDTQ